MSMNMNKEYRRELKVLRKSEVKIRRDLIRELLRMKREREIFVADSMRRATRATAVVHRSLQKLQQRQAILEGRLS